MAHDHAKFGVAVEYGTVPENLCRQILLRDEAQLKIVRHYTNTAVRDVSAMHNDRHVQFNASCVQRVPPCLRQVPVHHVGQSDLGSHMLRQSPGHRHSDSASSTQCCASGIWMFCGSWQAPTNLVGYMETCLTIESFTNFVHTGKMWSSIQPITVNGRGPITCT